MKQTGSAQIHDNDSTGHSCNDLENGQLLFTSNIQVLSYELQELHL